MKRRSFIKTSSLAAVPVLINGIPVEAIAKTTFANFVNPEDDRILVLIQLGGGNDGLNMIVPLDQYAQLYKVRDKIILQEDKITKLTDKTGIHPIMTGIKSMYDEGKIKLIQSVGYPNQNRSHFRSTDIWTSASSAEQYETTGWLGRAFQLKHPSYPTGYPNTEYADPLAITIGSLVSETCQGTSANFSIAINDPSTLRQLTEAEKGTLPQTNYGYELAYMINSIRQTNQYSDVVSDAYNKATNLSTKYPTGNALADRLKIVARLIHGGLKSKVYVVNIGGFDTHANQIDVLDDSHTTGTHANLLSQLSGAMEAFQDDLKLMKKEQQVVGMTFSEFGRQIKANDSTGTDHGTAAPMFLFGSCIKPGILGDNATISDNVQNGEGVAMQYDFRSVYASLLMDWFKLSESTVKSILYGEFQKLSLIEGCDTTTEVEDSARDFNLSLTAYPNPTSDVLNIKFVSKDESVRVSIFDIIGSEIKVLHQGKLNGGEHELKFNTNELSSGHYIVRVSAERAQKTKKFMVQ
ncbi:MAG TPA: DUF1501 domain-containing protein [Saprospiraceae bacterium]|nr:DUF1501 domain-containing protein [Saprospiraceae bacterium]